jgi:hypothetical protein
MTLPHVLQLAAIIAVGCGLYLALGFLFKVEEVQTLGRLVKRQLTG